MTEEMTDNDDGEMAERKVEIGVTGTWRETVVETSDEKAEEVVEERLKEHLGLEDGEWGDVGFVVVGSGKVEE